MKTNEQNIDISTTTMRNDPDDTPRSASDDASAAAGRTLAEIISDVAEQELAQYPPVSMTPEQLEAMVARRRAAREAADETTAGISNETVLRAADANADRTAGETMGRDAGSVMDGIAVSRDMEEIIDGTPDEAAIGISVSAAGRAAKNRRTLRIAGLAAVLMLALVGALLLLNTLTTDVGANKNEKEEIQTEDGVIIEDGGYGASDDVEDSIWQIEEWDYVASAKGAHPQLMVPEYIPNGYEFLQLTIESVETGDVICEYIFTSSEKETLEIEQLIQKNGEISMDINDVSRTVVCSKGTIHIQDGDNKRATIQVNDGLIRIWSNLSDAELIKITNSLIV